MLAQGATAEVLAEFLVALLAPSPIRITAAEEDAAQAEATLAANCPQQPPPIQQTRPPQPQHRYPVLLRPTEETAPGGSSARLPLRRPGGRASEPPWRLPRSSATGSAPQTLPVEMAQAHPARGVEPPQHRQPPHRRLQQVAPRGSAATQPPLPPQPR